MNLPIEYKVENFDFFFFKIFVAKQPSLVTKPKFKKKIVLVFSSGKFNMLSEYV